MTLPVLVELPELVVLRIAVYLGPEDTTRLGMTCRRLYDLLPKFIVMKGDNFVIYGPHGGHWAPELYFEGPTLYRPVKKLSVSVAGWVDQGWGNRKGQLFVKLMRGPAANSSVVTEKKAALFGIAEHKETSGEVELKESEEIVSLARPGDWYRFMRNAGGGGGHGLTVRGFRAVALLY